MSGRSAVLRQLRLQNGDEVSDNVDCERKMSALERESREGEGKVRTWGQGVFLISLAVVLVASRLCEVDIPGFVFRLDKVCDRIGSHLIQDRHSGLWRDQHGVGREPVGRSIERL